MGLGLGSGLGLGLGLGLDSEGQCWLCDVDLVGLDKSRIDRAKMAAYRGRSSCF